jgi:divalent metal cation (Fe/Co/Zn/Cd) transporter
VGPSGEWSGRAFAPAEGRRRLRRHLSLTWLLLTVVPGEPALAWWKQRTGREMGSRALVADAAETWVCSYLSLALLAGVGLHELFGWWWADPVGALAMLPVIVWQGWETLGEAREHEDQDDAGRSENLA